jgi:hypothetical protein
MKGLGIENKITLKHIVLGYKIDDKNYLALIFLIAVVGFSIYKSYYIVSLLHLVLIIQGYNQNYMKYIYNLNTISI